MLTFCVDTRPPPVRTAAVHETPNAKFLRGQIEKGIADMRTALTIIRSNAPESEFTRPYWIKQGLFYGAGTRWLIEQLRKELTK